MGIEGILNRLRWSQKGVFWKKSRTVKTKIFELARQLLPPRQTWFGLSPRQAEVDRPATAGEEFSRLIPSDIHHRHEEIRNGSRRQQVVQSEEHSHPAR